MQEFEFISAYYEKLFTFLWAKQVKSFFIQWTGQKSVDSDAIMKQAKKSIDQRTETLQIDKAIQDDNQDQESKQSKEDKDKDQNKDQNKDKDKSKSKSKDQWDTKDSKEDSNSDTKKITIDPQSDGKIVIEVKE